MDELNRRIRDRVLEQLKEQVGEKYIRQIDEKDWPKVWEEAKQQINNFSFGAQDAHWLAFYNYFLEVCNIKSCEVLRPLMDLAEEVSFWLPYENLCILSKKPKIILFDEEGRLHCDGGPAIQYRDDFGVYALHGVSVPEEIAVTPAEKLDPRKAFDTDNIELRRIILDKTGYAGLLEGEGATLIDRQVHDTCTVNVEGEGEVRAETIELFEITNVKDVEPIRVIKVHCPSSDRIYVLRVPPNSKDAAMARILTFPKAREHFEKTGKLLDLVSET